MKKLLLIVLILTICSIANAAAFINITDTYGNSELTLAPSDTVELLIWYTGETIGAFFIEVGATGPGTITNAVVTAVPRDPIYDSCDPYGIGWGISASAPSTGGPLYPGITYPLAELEFHCDSIGDVVIDTADIFIVNPGWSEIIPIFNGMVIHQTPEPTTISLLCLGAFILKRKK